MSSFHLNLKLNYILLSAELDENDDSKMEEKIVHWTTDPTPACIDDNLSQIYDEASERILFLQEIRDFQASGWTLESIRGLLRIFKLNATLIS